jgi:eukaryotic-like serine/threonine-protein kinase
MSSAQVSFYAVEGLLGQGTTGLVYRARDTRDGRLVAVKLLRPEADAEPERRSRFLREARAIAAIDHPHIAKIYEVGIATLSHEDAAGLGLGDSGDGEPRKLPFLALELLDGDDLGVVIGGEPLPLELVCELGSQMLGALAAAHKEGIVHRDLKPANVRITSNNQVKLLDFGLAKMVATSQLDPATASHLTLDGMVMGTLPYLAPEQLQGERVDGRADLFSFGVLFFEMLTGKPPFSANTLVEYARSLIHSRIEKPSVRRPGLPSCFDQLALELMATEPAERPESAADALAMLESCRLVPATPPSVPTPPETAPAREEKAEDSPQRPAAPPSKRWPSWLVLGLPLGLLLVLFLLLLSTR